MFIIFPSIYNVMYIIYFILCINKLLININKAQAEGEISFERLDLHFNFIQSTRLFKVFL